MSLSEEADQMLTVFNVDGSQIIQSSTSGTTEWASPRQPSRMEKKTVRGIEKRNEQQQHQHFYKGLLTSVSI